MTQFSLAIVFSHATVFIYNTMFMLLCYVLPVHAARTLCFLGRTVFTYSTVFAYNAMFSMLQSANVQNNLQIGQQFQFDDLLCLTDPSPESLWEQLKTVMLQASKEVLRLTVKKNRDWHDENCHDVHELLVKKRSALQACVAWTSCQVKAAFRLACSDLHCNL